DSLGGSHEGRVLLRANALGGILIHGDDFAGRDDLQAPDIAERPIGRTDEHDRNAELLNCLAGSRNDLARGTVAAHRIEGDGKRGQSTSIAWRPWYQPQFGQTTCGSLARRHCGHMLRAGSLRVQAEARRLRLFDFEVFFLGTAIVASSIRSY